MGKTMNNFIDIIKTAACKVIFNQFFPFNHPSTHAHSTVENRWFLTTGFVLYRTKTTLTMQKIFYSLRYNVRVYPCGFKRSIKRYY